MLKKITENDISKADLTIIKSSNATQIVPLAVKKFSQWTSIALSNWSHQKNSPWDIAVQNKGKYTTINKGDMKTFFTGILHAGN